MPSVRKKNEKAEKNEENNNADDYGWSACLLILIM